MSRVTEFGQDAMEVAVMAISKNQSLVSKSVKDHPLVCKDFSCSTSLNSMTIGFDWYINMQSNYFFLVLSIVFFNFL